MNYATVAKKDEKSFQTCLLYTSNGAVGIAVGMATNIPPHNLTETIDATFAVMDDPDITVMELMDNYIKGPDFPTGGIILGRSGIRQAYETGRGSIIRCV